MSEEKNTLPPEGPAKPAQNLEKIVSLSPRERLLLPLTFKMNPTSAIIMLAAIYYGAMYGGSTTAIMVNIPGDR